MKKYNDRKNSYRKKNQFLVIGLLVAFLLTIALGYFAVYKFLPNTKTSSVYENIENLNAKGLNVLYDNEYISLENRAIIKNGVTYLPADFVQKEFDPYVFWEANSDRLTITTLNEVIAMKVKELEYFVNGEQVSLNLPLIKENDMGYLPDSFLSSMYPVKIEYKNKYNILVIDKLVNDSYYANILKDTPLRFKPNIKSFIAQTMKASEKVYVLEDGEKFTKVRTEDGIIGYVKNKSLSEKTKIDKVETEKEEDVPKVVKKIEGKVVLLWDQISAGNSEKLSKQEKVPAINVLSPTWFSFDENSENKINNVGSHAYTEAAHQNGYQVWPILSDNFKSKVSERILMKAENRDAVIKQILAFVAMYNVDGINIDFEAVTEKSSPYYLQFLRELNPPLKELGATLSVDMFVPLYTKHYNRTEVAKVADYICVMAYDEHYSGSETTGPVASLGFVEEGIVQTLKEVPKEKILMGIPFYNRVWTEGESDVNGKLKKDDMGMRKAYDLFKSNNVDFAWQEDSGYNYGEYPTKSKKGEPVIKKVWLEDEKSIAEKMKIAEKYDVGGVACWSRGLEKNEVWDIISEFDK